jgi:hypothetical protein
MDIIKNWLMVVLAGFFVLLYTVALLGWLKPLSEATVVTRLEPLIFIVIGYYFGRLPAREHEEKMMDEIDHQTKKTEAVQHSRERILQEREALEEKLKNVKTILTSSPGIEFPKKIGGTAADADEPSRLRRQAITNAVNILNS